VRRLGLEVAAGQGIRRCYERTTRPPLAGSCLTRRALYAADPDVGWASRSAYFSLSHKRRAFGLVGPLLGIMVCAAELLFPAA
jgi:hypothetical protein